MCLDEFQYFARQDFSELKDGLPVETIPLGCREFVPPLWTLISLHPQRFSRVNLHKMQTHLLMRKNNINMKTNVNRNYIPVLVCFLYDTKCAHEMIQSNIVPVIMVLWSYLYIAACMSNKHFFQNLHFFRAQLCKHRWENGAGAKKKRMIRPWKRGTNVIVGQGDFMFFAGLSWEYILPNMQKSESCKEVSTYEE